VVLVVFFPSFLHGWTLSSSLLMFVIFVRQAGLCPNKYNVDILPSFGATITGAQSGHWHL
jgi:hypothetical protein